MKAANTRVTLIVRLERLGQDGEVIGPVWERSVSEIDEFPGHLLQAELFTVAHAQMHPPRPLTCRLRD
jgi:hypothetical protein